MDPKDVGNEEIYSHTCIARHHGRVDFSSLSWEVRDGYEFLGVRVYCQC